MRKVEELKNDWEEICNDYLFQFCDKHEFEYWPDAWVGNKIGTTAMIGDMFVSLDDIRYDIDNHVLKGAFEQWYWKGLEIYELTNLKYMNFESFCKGAPDEWDEKRMNSIRAAKKKIDDAKREFEDLIEDYKKQNNKF